MPESPSRFTWLVRLARAWTVTTVVLVALAMAATVAEGVMAAMQGAELRSLMWWILALLGEMAGGVLALVLGGLVETIVAAQEAAASTADQVRRLESILGAVHESTRRLADLSQLSDAARSLLFREQEVHAMEELLHDELIRQEYDKAEALVREVEQRFGHAEQAQRMRRLIQLAREGSIEQRVESAVARIETLLEAHNWTQATSSIRRLMRLLPDNPRIAQLPQRVRAAKVEHKRQLLQGYGEAVGKGDIDRSIELLRELDKYLAPQEAAALEESARDVFRAKLHNLGVQFAIRVTDEAWSEAVEIGQQIVREYPNSRMAQEVRMKMDTLRALAAGTERGNPALRSPLRRAEQSGL